MSQILILEQRPERMAEFRRLLEPKYNLTFADSLKKAIQTAKEKDFVLYISALHLPRTETPGESVFDFVKATKADPKTKEIPFFYCCIKPSTMMQSMADVMQSTAKSLGAEFFELVNPGELSAMPEHVAEAVESGRKKV
jgi:CheY-like chemotaxis protein